MYTILSKCVCPNASSLRLDRDEVLTIIVVIMSPKNPFVFVYAPQVRDHLQAIERKHHGLIRQAIEDQLHFEPEVETRNRKPLKRVIAFGAEWEIRCGPNNRFRVFYEVDLQANTVYVLAIGEKVRDRLHIGGEEVEL